MLRGTLPQKHLGIVVFAERPILLSQRSAAAGALEDANRANLHHICKKYKVGCDDELMAVWLRMMPRQDQPRI